MKYKLEKKKSKKKTSEKEGEFPDDIGDHDVDLNVWKVKLYGGLWCGELCVHGAL